MKNLLYFYTKPQLDNVGDDIFESNGWKEVYVFEIIDNVPKLFFDLEIGRSDNTLDEMNEWLSNNGHELDNFSFVEL